jgi:hypothetical protein
MVIWSMSKWIGLTRASSVQYYFGQLSPLKRLCHKMVWDFLKWIYPHSPAYELHSVWQNVQNAPNMIHGNNYENVCCFPPEQCKKWLANLVHFLSTCLCFPSAGFANCKLTSEKITKTMPRSDWKYSSLIGTDKNKQPIIIKLTLVG